MPAPQPPQEPFDLEALLSEAEGQHFERKSLWAGPPEAKQPRRRKAVRDQVAEYVAAFANAEGGTLLMGVEDDRTVTGHGYPPEVIRGLLQTPAKRLKPPQPEGLLVCWEGHELLVFRVPPAPFPVQVLGSGYPWRRQDETLHQTSEALLWEEPE